MEEANNKNDSSSCTNNDDSGDNSPTPNRGATIFNDGSSAAAASFAGSGQMMNPMAFMGMGFPGMMSNMPNNPQDMMNMMAYCQSANANGFGMGMGNNMGAFAVNNNGAQNQTSDSQRSPQTQHMAEMMLGKRAGEDDGGQPPAAKRANLGPSPAGDKTSPLEIKEEASSSGETSAGNPDSDSKPAALTANPPTSTSITVKDGVLIPPSNHGIKFYSRNDVLCGRGGGTNVHPGNRRFRDLINTNRRAYLKARKNDKPTISRSIVRTIRETKGRFLKKDENVGLWLEIGDDSAREKTSQALRQRAPEMRKILFEDEQRQQEQQEMVQRQQLMGTMGMAAGQGMPSMGGNFAQMPTPMASMNGNMNNFAPVMGGNQAMGNNGNGNNPQALLAKYNMLHQNNWLEQEKNMIMQRLAMSGFNSNVVNNLQNNNIGADNTIMQQGIKSETKAT